MKSKRKLWVIALTLACFFLGASFWSLTPSSANRGSANSSPNVASSVEPSVDQTQATARSKGRTTLHATGKYKELLFQDAADLPENVSGLSIAPKPVLLERVDLNQDGYADLVGAYIGENGGELRVRFGNRAGELGEPQAYDMKDARPEGIAFGDFNVDGHTDVAISNGEVGTVSLMYGDEKGALSPTAPIQIGGKLGKMAVADVNRDGIDDLFIVDESNGTVRYLVGQGELAKTEMKVLAPVGLGRLADVKLADFDNDFYSDIVIASNSGLAVLYGDGKGSFKREERLPYSDSVNGLVISDLDSDHHPDIAIAGTSTVTVWTSRLENGFAKGRAVAAGRDIKGLTVGNFNNDNYFDLAVINGEKSQVSVLLNKGKKSFSSPMAMDVEQGPISITSGNFRLNGYDGIAVGKDDGRIVMAIVPQVVVIQVSTLNDENDCPSCTIQQLTALRGPLGAPGGGTGISLREALTAINNDFILLNRANQGVGFLTLSTRSGPPPAANVEFDQLSTCGTIPSQTYWFIALTNGNLPPILSPGTSIEGDIVNTVANGGPGNTLGPKVVLSGGGINITSSAPGVIIKNLAIINAPGNAIIVASNNNQILNNNVGLDCDTVTAGPNNGVGILLTGASNTQVINNFSSANTGDGIQVNGISLSIPVPQSNLFDRNTVGLTRLGGLPIGPMGPVPNGGNGILVQNGAVGNTISNSVISGNTMFGVNIRGNITSNTIVRLNRVGTDPSGQMARPNGMDGVGVSTTGNSKFNQVTQNLISGNTGNGVSISSADTQAQFNTVSINRVGVNSTGSVQVPNGLAGLLITGSSNQNTVGGTVAANFNQIAGNNGVGIRIGGMMGAANPNNNLISFNDIGLNNLRTGAPFDPATPAAPVPRSNKGGGIVIDGAAFANTISQNSIAFNNDTGVTPAPAPNPAILCSGIAHMSTASFNKFTQNNIFLNPPDVTPVTPNIRVATGNQNITNAQIVAPPSLVSLIEINSAITITSTGQTTIKGTINYNDNGIPANINNSTIEIFVSRRGLEFAGDPVAAQTAAEGQLFLNSVISFQPNPQNPNALDWSASLTIPAPFLNPVQTNTVFVTATTTTGDGSSSPFSIAKVPQFVSGVGQCQFNVTPNPVNFTATAVGQATTQSLTLTNAGNSLITVTNLTLPANSPFSVAGVQLPIVLNPSQSATVNVTFTPANANNTSATLTIENSCTGTATTVSLNGRVCQPTIAVNPASVNFGNVNVGQTANSTVQVSNSGCTDSTLMFTASLAPNTPGAFSIVNVSSGSPATVNLSFAPGNAGTFNGTLVITSTNASNSPVNVPLTGVGVQPQQPQLQVLPANVNFGDVAVSTTATQSITVRNVGTGTLTLSTPVVQSGSNAGFSVSTPPSLSLGPGIVTTMQVSFAPTQSGTANGSVLVSSNAGNQTIVLAGNGTSSRINVSTNSVDFGSIAVNQAAPARSIVITNTGSAPLDVRTFSITGGSANGFTLSNTTPFTVQPNANNTISVGFTPNSVGTKNDTLIITSSDPSTPTVTVNLTGIGRDSSAPAVSVQSVPTAVGAGQQFRVTFSASDDVGVSTFEIRLSTNGGASFDTTVGSGNAQAGTNTFTATAPILETNAAMLQVLVRDAANNVGTATSGTFVIANPPNIFGATLVNGKFTAVASGSNIQPGAVLVVGTDTFPLQLNGSGSRFQVRRSTTSSSGRRLNDLAPRGSSITISIRNPNGVSSSPATVTAQ